MLQKRPVCYQSALLNVTKAPCVLQKRPACYKSALLAQLDMLQKRPVGYKSAGVPVWITSTKWLNPDFVTDFTRQNFLFEVPLWKLQ